VTTDPTGARAQLADLVNAALAGRYLLERELGHGGMATVYLARDLRHERLVALKVMHPDLCLGAGPERFLREIRTTARLDHPHILPVHDSGEAQGLLWYTMPYVEGESVRQRLERAGPFPVEEALRVAREAADALDCAHRRGVVHRDVKPENIMLSGGYARVADFGIATALVAAGDGGRLTATGISIGTPAYMSPEQAGGARALDGRSDVYSLGCVLFEMLTGQAPFTGPTPQAVIASRFLQSPPPVGQLREAVPPAIEDAVTRALAREPADRFQTAAEFAQALAGLPSTASVGPRRRPPRPAPPGRRRWLVLGVSLLVLAIGFGLWRQLRVRPGVAAADQPPPGAIGARRLAVLPFEHVGDSAEAYFADGITDEVRGKLATLAGLEVIAGASSGEYRRTVKPAREIARELGVRYLLVGKVQSEKPPGGGPPTVRVSPELIEVGGPGPPTTRWQEPFEAPLTGVFEVQAAIAARVAEALGVALGVGERQALARPLTRNLDAYRAFVRGEVAKGANAASARQSLPYYEQAIALDSGFAEAWARASMAHSNVFGGGGVPSPAEAAAARAGADRALALAPDLPEARLALGSYYMFVLKDIGKALEQFSEGLRLAPNHAELLANAGVAEQWLNRWDAALEHYRRAQVLDPRSVNGANALAYALLQRRQYAEAHAVADRVLALSRTAPLSVEIVELKAMIHVAQGDLPGARAVIHRALERIEPTTLVAFFGWAWDLYWVLDDPEQQLLLRVPPTAYDNNRASWGLVLAQTYALRGNAPLARAYADSARLALDEQLRGTPDDAQLHTLKGLALAYLGMKQEAVREGKRGVSLMPAGAGTLQNAYVKHQLVRIYLLVGEPEQALDELEPLLRTPYLLSPGWLRVDPNFAPLKGNPRFRQLSQDVA
jgi:serine/threonine-protein kinase